MKRERQGLLSIGRQVTQVQLSEGPCCERVDCRGSGSQGDPSVPHTPMLVFAGNGPCGYCCFAQLTPLQFTALEVEAGPWKQRLPSVRCRMRGSRGTPYCRQWTNEIFLSYLPPKLQVYAAQQVVYMERDHQELSESVQAAPALLKPMFAQMATAKRSEALGVGHTEHLFKLRPPKTPLRRCGLGSWLGTRLDLTAWACLSSITDLIIPWTVTPGQPEGTD